MALDMAIQTTPNEQIRMRRTIADNVADDMTAKFDDGTYAVGSLLPGQRALAVAYKVAPVTIQQAITKLVKAGRLRVEKGRGTFVAETQASPLRRPVRPRSIEPNSSFASDDGMTSITRGPHIGFIISFTREANSELNISFSSVMARAFEGAMSQLSGSTLMRDVGCYAPSPPDVTFDAAESLIAAGAQAIALVGLPETYTPDKLLDRFSRLQVPFVLVEHEPRNICLPQVYFDGRDAGRKAANHLLSRGSRELLYFSAQPMLHSWVASRLTGVQDCVRLYDDAKLTTLITDEELGIDETVRQLWLSRQMEHQSFPEAVVASNDQSALTFMDYAEKLGYVAGRDYLILGFDDLRTGQLRGLTSMRPPLEALAREGAKLLVEQLRTGHAPARVCLHAILIARETTDRAVQADVATSTNTALMAN